MVSILENPAIKSKCQIFTPDDIVIQILNYVEYEKNLYGRTVLDHSCGNGQFLKEVVRRYIKDCITRAMPVEQIRLGLSRDIWGAEMDPILFSSCISTLNQVANEHQIGRVNWNIFNYDSLRNSINRKFDFIVGNPPYLSYWDIPEDERKFMREKYESCKYGAFDYCFAFIEEGLSLLNESGYLAYIIPNSIFKTKAAKLLREKMKPSLKSVYDFKSNSVFSDVLTSSAVIILDNNHQADTFTHTDLTTMRLVELRKDALKDIWVFKQTPIFRTGITYRFGDYFKVSASVATQYNKAFVTVNWKEDGIWLKGPEDNKIELNATRKAASPKGRARNHSERIIFPYLFKKGKRYGYEEREYRMKYPNTYRYLKRNKDSLMKRSADEKAKWFEYGRSQALDHLQQRKLLLSTVITDGVCLFKLDKDEVPYSGLFIVPTGDLSISDGIRVLKSAEFYEYVKSVGINVNGSSLRVTARNISDYRWQQMG